MRNSFPRLEIQVCLTEEEIARDFFRSLERNELEERFFYWFPLSVNAWLRLCDSKRYRNYARSSALARKVSRKFPKRIRARSLQWISLGCGQGAKEIPFLESLRESGKRVRYVPLDSSQPLLEMAVRRAAGRGIPTLGLKANFKTPQHLEKIPPRLPREVRVVSIFGNTLGNFGRRGWIRVLAKRMQPGDFLLIDGELFGGSASLVEYDHPVNRRFALAPLVSVGITESDGKLGFQLEENQDAGVYRLSKTFHFKRSKKILFSGHPLSFRKGQILQMSPSHKYRREAMEGVLEGGGLFELKECHESPDRRFALWIVQRK